MHFLCSCVIRFDFLVLPLCQQQNPRRYQWLAAPPGELCSSSQHTSPPPTARLRASVLNSQSEWRQER